MWDWLKLSWNWFYQSVKSRSLRYWFFWLVSVAVGIWLSPLTENSDALKALRYRVTGLVDRLSPRPARPHSTVLVEITDEDFWSHELKGRIPISRAYLSRLINSLAFYGPSVIVVDLNLSSQTGEQALDYSSYQKEDQELSSTINTVGRHTKLVLPLLLRCPGKPTPNSQHCTPVPTPFYSASSKLVAWGYLNLPDDLRKVPLDTIVQVNESEQRYLSLALAAAQFHSPTIAEWSLSYLPYISFMYPRSFDGRRFDAGQVLKSYKSVAHPKDECEPLQFRDNLATADQHQFFARINSQIVVIGARYHPEGRETGDPIDFHSTPVGPLPGYELHANYIEAILDERISVPASHISLLMVEMGITIILTLVLISPLSESFKFLYLLAALVSLFAIAYIGAIALGMFVEILLPAFFVAVHFLLELVIDWRKEAHHAKFSASLPQ
jgi:CHASE2 domain-containing sensor protein